ncbi:hypothetical protein KR074_007758, partial [Drosophila pseudoananassae]
SPESIKISNKISPTVAVFFLFVYAGMDLAHSSGWNQTLNASASQQFECSWFIGVLAGAAISSMAMSFIPKMPFYVLGALMQLAGAIMYATAPYNYAVLLAARYVAGIGVGLITVPFIIHSAEVASDNYRGISGSMEQCGLALGIAIQVIFDSQYVDDRDSSVNQIHGILGIVFCLLGLVLTSLSIESPIFHIRRNQEETARRCQEKILGNFTHKVDMAFEEAKGYVADSRHMTFWKELLRSLVPLVKVLVYRGFVAFSFSLPLTTSLISSTLLTEGYIASWPVTVWGLVRLLGTLVAQAFLERLGRKLFSLVALFCMAGLILSMAFLYEDPNNVRSFNDMLQIRSLGVAFQAFAGLFVCSSPVYLGEAFPLRVKPLLVGYVIGFEQTVHIINIVGYRRASSDFFYHYYLSVGIILLLGVILFAVVMPETKRLTLREAGRRIQRWHNLRCF